MAVALLCAVHVLALGAVITSQLPAGLRLVLVVLVAGSLWLTLRRYAWRVTGDAIVAVTWTERDVLEIEFVDGRRAGARIEPASAVFHWMMVLHLRNDQRKWRLCLLPDMLDAESWRRLSVRLRSVANTH